MSKWYNIQQAQGSASARVDLSNGIGMDDPDQYGNCCRVADFIRQFNAIAAPAIDLHINSDGGAVVPGMEIYNAIKNHPATVTAYIDSMAASIASVIACAADKIIIEPNAFMAIHNVRGAAPSGDASALRKTADMFDQMTAAIAQIYADCTGQKPEAVKAAMDATRLFSAADALNFGLVDEIAEADPDEGEEQQAVNFMRIFSLLETTPPEFCRFAARLIQPTRKESPMSTPLSPIIRDGKCFVKIGDAEHEIDMTVATNQLPNAQAQTNSSSPEVLAAAKSAGVQDGIAAERAHRAMFNSIARTANITGDALADFEAKFYNRSEDDIKWAASQFIAGRAKPVGEEGNGNGEGQQQTDEQKENARLQSLAVNRFAENANLRQLFKCNNDNPESATYKLALNRYLATEKTCRSGVKHGRGNKDNDPVDAILRNTGIVETAVAR